MKSFLSRIALFIPAFLLAFSIMAPGSAYAHDDGGTPSSPKPEIHITGNGKAIVRGAVVTGISGSIITAETRFGSSTALFTVKTGSSTEFVSRGGKNAGFSDIAVNDTVSFSGSIEAGSIFVVNANVVKDWSNIPEKNSFGGTVSAIATSTSSFSLTTQNDGVITVKIASTTLLASDGQAILFSNLHVGDRVKASGAYEAATKTLTAEKVQVTFGSQSSLRGFMKLWKDKFLLTIKSKHASDD